MPEIGVGILGYDGVAKAHLQALVRATTIFWPPRVRPVLVAVAGRAAARVDATARRYGAHAAYTDWRRLIEDPKVQVLINAGPNDVHAEASIAAAGRGLHVLCEKPLARNAVEAAQMRDAAVSARVVHMAGYNYRFTPAVLLARRLIAEGRLGRIYHFRTRYSDDSMVDPHVPYGWRHSRARAGSGVIGDLAAHAVDLARFLVGEIQAISACSRIFVDRRPRRDGGIGTVDVEDALEAILEFEGGAVGTLEASTFCLGWKNLFTFEVNGEHGSLAWNLERLNELQVYLEDGEANGFRTVLATEPSHPYGGTWWPPGHTLGWEHTFVHQLQRFFEAIAGGGTVAPEGATFDDGVRCAVVCDLLDHAAREGRRVEATGARV
ncbi:MAG: Gfo/Idh/MocA family oxidoreductase [Armatimonadota bacterium]|nr:Gfo/Idh/MocA family oxidoreductase [Armatimonadota bacterium]